MDMEKSDLIKVLWISTVLVLGIVAVVITLIVFGFREADQNRDKVMQYNRDCLEHGFAGWDYDLGCYGEHPTKVTG